MGILDPPPSRPANQPRMAPPRRNPTLHTCYYICLLLLVSTATISAAVTASSYYTACPSLSPAQDRHTKADDALSLVRSFQISAGKFSRGADGSFFPGDDPYNARSFYFFPHGASRTDDPALVHLAATFTLNDPFRNDSGADSVSFFLDGYYSSATLELCMVGTGTERTEDGSLKHYPDVALRLRVPSPPTLADPFVTGSLEGGAGLGTIRLLAYAEGDDYVYGSKRAACSPSPPKQPASGSLRVLGGDHPLSVCAHLTPQLMTSYRLRLEHGGTLLPRMRVNQVHCAVDGAGVHVRAYAVLSNDTTPTERREYYRRQRRFLVREEAVVADGHWDTDRRMLCLRACRVELPVPPSAPAVPEHGCGIGMSFWFPAVWTMRERSVVAGMLWNSTQAGAGLITASSMDGQRSSTNLSDVKYSYNDTLLNEAMKHYLKISKEKKITVGSHLFPDFNTTHRDFQFGFYGPDIGSGHADPVTIGSVMVAGNMLAADDAFSWQPAVVDDTKQDLLVNVSYDIRYSAPRDNWVRASSNMSYYSNYSMRPQRRRISAEGLYDPKRGLLCMVGCQERNGSTDCQILVTVQFAAVDSMAHEHGTGVISSLRDKTDGLFFEKIQFTLYGMYATEVSEAILRMDLESIMSMASTTLSCVFIVLQILHTRRNPEVAPATSVTMLTVLTMGYLAPLALNTEALFASRRSRYFPYEYSTSRWIEMNEVVMRAPTLIAFVLQLRLLQLVWSGRRTSTLSDRTVLWICVPLYVLGGVLAAVVHMINAHAATSRNPSGIVMGGGPATIWEDLVSYAGLVLDGFLLPQVILNASLGGSRARAISPWFYIGGTMVRVAPHVYDVARVHVYKPSMHSSDLYASPHGDFFGVAWDVVIPCGAALLALLMFLQQRLGGTASLPSERRSGGYEMVSNI
ncbi:uncharacterized protein [Aegilops tauschii subsp. strangulata]|uniref:RING-type E3 ubiquitin transferase n=1 Tax=Aegilops tauschii subsp. strangulata TaxID=200361 RepID=A0A453GR19_AEGTS|nr:uncharacterized protein LOC109783880 [Aegilops tauschii subsp. strangulata]